MYGGTPPKELSPVKRTGRRSGNFVGKSQPVSENSSAKRGERLSKALDESFARPRERKSRTVADQSLTGTPSVKQKETRIMIDQSCTDTASLKQTDRKSTTIDDHTRTRTPSVKQTERKSRTVVDQLRLGTPPALTPSPNPMQKDRKSKIIFEGKPADESSSTTLSEIRSRTSMSMPGDKKLNVTEADSSTTVDAESKRATLLSRMSERYPTEHAAARLTDAKQVRLLVEKLAAEGDPAGHQLTEEVLHQMTSQFLTHVGAAMSRAASGTDRRVTIMSTTTSIIETTIEERGSHARSSGATGDAGVSGAARQPRTVHRLRPLPRRKPPLSVAPHVIHAPPEPGCQQEKPARRETLATLLQSRAARRRRERSAAAKRRERSRELERRLEEAERMENESRRVLREQALLDGLLRERLAWDTRGGALEVRAKVKIIVIGAGLAGLSAAGELMRRGFSDVMVLEASQRLGGRLHSVRLCGEEEDKCGDPSHATDPGCLAELGAPAWICEDPSNSIYALARDRGLLEWTREHKRPLCRVLTPDGRQLDESVVATALRFCQHTARDAQLLYTKVLASDHRERTSLAVSDYRRVRRGHLLAGLGEADRRDLTVAVDSIWTAWSCFKGDSQGDMAADLVGSQAQWEHAQPRRAGDLAPATSAHDIEVPMEVISPSLVSVSSLSRGVIIAEEAPPSRKVLLPSASQLCTALTRRFSPGTVKFGRRVSRVDWADFCSKTVRDGLVPQVTVLCSPGGGKGKDYRADHVIMAVPPGHLKEFAGEMFKPPLPDEKLAAIERIGVGTVSRMVLYYSGALAWRAPFHLVWAGRKPEDAGYDAASLTSRCLQVTTAPSSLHVLEVTLLGELPTRAASDDAHVASEMSEILQKLLESSSEQRIRRGVPPPDRVVRSAWGEDPLYRGSHPYLRRGCHSSDLASLAFPVTFRGRPVVQFAGDYTWPDYGRLTHAARSSGLREAKRLANFYDKYFGYENTNPSFSEKAKLF